MSLIPRLPSSLCTRLSIALMVLLAPMDRFCTLFKQRAIVSDNAMYIKGKTTEQSTDRVMIGQKAMSTKESTKVLAWGDRARGELEKKFHFLEGAMGDQAQSGLPSFFKNNTGQTVVDALGNLSMESAKLANGGAPAAAPSDATDGGDADGIDFAKLTEEFLKVRYIQLFEYSIRFELTPFLLPFSSPHCSASEHRGTSTGTAASTRHERRRISRDVELHASAAAPYAATRPRSRDEWKRA